MTKRQRLIREKEKALANLYDAMERARGWQELMHVSEPTDDLKKEIEKWEKEHTRLSNLLDKMDAK